MSGLFIHAAFLVFAAAAAGTRVVAADFGSSATRWRLRLEMLPPPQGGQLCQKGFAVIKKAFISGTQVIQAGLSVRRLQETIFRTFAIAHCSDFTCPAIAGKCVRFGPAEGYLGRAFEQFEQRCRPDISQAMFGIDEVITCIKVTVVFDDGDITTGFAKDTQGLLLAENRSDGLFEQLDFDLADVKLHPFVEDRA